MADAISQKSPSLTRHLRENTQDGVSRRSTKRRRRASETHQSREIGLMRQNDGANAPSFVGSSSGIHFVRSVYHALTKSRAQQPAQTPDQNIVPGEEDRLDPAVPYGSKTLWSSNEVDEPTDRRLDFDFVHLQTWSESYFDHWHTAYPFIHAPSILEHMEREVQADTLNTLRQQRSPNYTILRAIMSISLADRRQSGLVSERPIPASLVFLTFNEAMQSVQDMVFMPSSTEALQAIVSVQLFLVSMLRLNSASRLGGVIVRMAFQLGLHRCPTRYSGFGTEQSEMRRRLFWVIYCIDRHLCQSLGLPLSIRDDDVDVCYFGEEKHAMNGHQPLAMDYRLQTLNFLTKHAFIKGQIVELRNKSVHQRTADKDKATLIGARLDKWANELQYSLGITSDDDGGITNKLHQAVLSVLHHESVISLNRPLLALEKRTAENMAALQACIRASMSIISILHNYLRSTQATLQNPPGPLLWPSLTWCVWMAAFIVLHAAIEGEMPKPIARRLAEQSVEVLKHLAQRGSVWPNVCAVAIDDLFTRLLLDSVVSTPQSPGTSQSERPTNDSGSLASRRIASDQLGGLEQVPLNGFRQTEQPEYNGLYSHATNVTGPFPSTFDAQASVPWLSEPDAAAVTSANIFEQFDIPFWMGDDQYSSLMDFDL